MMEKKLGDKKKDEVEGKEDKEEKRRKRRMGRRNESV